MLSGGTSSPGERNLGLEVQSLPRKKNPWNSVGSLSLSKGNRNSLLVLVFIYQLSLGSGSHVAAGIIPTRHGKANKWPWVFSSSPSPCVMHVSQQTFAAGILYQSLLPLSEGLSRDDFLPPLHSPPRWVSRLSRVLCLTGEEAGIRGEEVMHGESGAMLETVHPPSCPGQEG